MEIWQIRKVVDAGGEYYRVEKDGGISLKPLRLIYKVVCAAENEAQVRKVLKELGIKTIPSAQSVKSAQSAEQAEQRKADS